jgi:hypothetical protein
MCKSTIHVMLKSKPSTKSMLSVKTKVKIENSLWSIFSHVFGD